MREEFDKVKQFRKCIPVDLHRNVLAVKYDTVLVVVNIRGILEAPFLALDRDRDDPVVFSCGMVCPSGISLVFHTELTFWIGGGFCFPGSSDSLRILLRLGEVDGDIESAVLSLDSPLSVFLDPVTADIIAVLA